MQYREELEGLADQIRRHPLLELTEFSLGSPLDQSSIDAAEMRLGAPLPRSLRNLCQSFDGAALRWRIRNDLDEGSQRRVDEELASMDDRYGIYQTAGVVQLLPLQDMLFGEEFQIEQLDPHGGRFDFCGESYTNNEFTGMLRILDAVEEFTAMAFVVQGGESEWKMLRLTHNWFEFDQSRTTYLEDYLAFIITTWGLLSAREELFSEYRGDRREPLTFDPDLAISKVSEIFRNP